MLTMEWAALGVILSFIGMLTAFFYRRWVNYEALVKKQTEYNIELHDLKTMFAQYQLDMKQYLSVCEICRAEVRVHHEDADKHVTNALATQINRMSEDINQIKNFLMKNGSK